MNILCILPCVQLALQSVINGVGGDLASVFLKGVTKRCDSYMHTLRDTALYKMKF